MWPILPEVMLMNIKEQFERILEKLNKLESSAQNPFLRTDFSANPFKDAFSQTYVWVEDDREEEGKQ